MKHQIIFLILLLLGFSSNALSYTKEDWAIYEECKEQVYEKRENQLDYTACKKMLGHKNALRKYGASASYKYWINRLYK